VCVCVSINNRSGMVGGQTTLVTHATFTLNQSIYTILILH